MAGARRPSEKHGRERNVHHGPSGDNQNFREIAPQFDSPSRNVGLHADMSWFGNATSDHEQPYQYCMPSTCISVTDADVVLPLGGKLCRCPGTLWQKLVFTSYRENNAGDRFNDQVNAAEEIL
jgi:hypothetical protein